MMKKIENEKKVKQTFEQVWGNESISKRNSLLYRIYDSTIGKFNSTRFLYNIIKSELRQKNLKHELILEPGCGKGNAAVLLGRLGIKQYLLDISPNALALVKQNFKANNITAETNFVEASMFEMPIEDEKFTFIWNEGVIEHFNEEEQLICLREYSRVLKKHGKMVIIIPNANAWFYKKAMAHAIKNGSWEFGYEKPEYTLSHLINKIPELEIEHEYSRGFLNQFGFFRYYIKSPKIKTLFLLIFSFFQVILHPLNYIPGYYLVTVIRKK